MRKRAAAISLTVLSWCCLPCQAAVTIGDGSIVNFADATIGFGCADLVVVGQDGGTQNSGADLAEFVPTSGTAPQPGDVVEIDPTVAGVISTQPGVTLNAQQPALASTEGPALALAGRIPVKATNANGAIHIGDLLVASSLPGHAMRASATPAPGSVIGKALANFDAADGVLSMLVWGH